MLLVTLWHLSSRLARRKPGRATSGNGFLFRRSEGNAIEAVDYVISFAETELFLDLPCSLFAPPAAFLPTAGGYA
jgi:hypothetical protein